MLVNNEGKELHPHRRQRSNVEAYRLVGPKLEPLDLVKVPKDVPSLLLQFWKGFWMNENLHGRLSV